VVTSEMIKNTIREALLLQSDSAALC